GMEIIANPQAGTISNTNGWTKISNEKAHIIILLNDNKFTLQALPEITVYEKQHYLITFNGWFDAEQGGNAVITGEQNYVKELNIYAQYTEQEVGVYTLNISPSNGVYGNNDPTSITLHTGETYTVKNIVRTGYIFKGWTHSGSGSFNEQTSIFTMGEGNATLTASWQAIKYTIKFNKNNENAVGEMLDQTFTYNIQLKLSQNLFTLVGATFKGWATQADSTVKVYDDEQNILNITEENDAIITLYAIWEPITISVKYDASTNGGSSTQTNITKEYGQSIDLTPQATKLNWNFVGWNIDENATQGLEELVAGDKDVTLYAIYSKTISVKFYQIDGTNETVSVTLYNKETEKEFETPEVAEQENKQVVGWTNSSLSTEKIFESSQTQTLSIQDNNNSYFAVYCYSVSLTFDANGGTGNMNIMQENAYLTANTNSQPIFTQASFELPSCEFEKEFHTFNGWIDLITAEKYNVNDEILLNEDATIYADWQMVIKNLSGEATLNETSIYGDEITATLIGADILLLANREQLEYQWFYATNKNLGFTRIEGAKSSSFKISGANYAKKYIKVEITYNIFT
ncbi:MAG: InlB B-repeat-containing protein, partial [Clostridia bacterium]|nr:InlB B-repeat-containing protein [Clostridia bacterium]